MIATGDFKISASGRKVRRLIKVGDDDYNKADDIDKDGDVDANDKKLAKEQVEDIQEISSKLAGNYYAAATKKHIEKVGVKPNMYDRIEKDMGKNRKAGIDRAFSRLTKEEVELEEATVKSAKYSWGTMKTVHHGKDFSIPLHPEHHKPIAALKHGESHSFKDETGAKWKATREDDTVHFHGGSYGTQKTSVKHDTMKESVELDEAADKQDSRLMQLARLGLLDKSDVATFRTAMQTFKADKQLSIKQRNMLLSVYNDLVNMVTGDDAMFARAKLDIQKEETELEEGKRGLWDNIHAKRKRIAAGSGEKMRKPGSEGAPTAQDFKDAAKTTKEEVEQIDEISKETLASYIPKAAKDARIHGQIATDFENRGKTARKPGSKDSWNRLSMKYKEKAWKRDDGISKAVTKLTKEETQSEGYYKDIDTNEKEDKRLGVWKKETPWRKVKPGSDTTVDKSGAVHTPMSKVRHLARLALKKTSSK